MIATALETRRMRLVPATAALVRAEMIDRELLAGLLSAVVPEGWPPETVVDALPFFLDALEAEPHHVGWYAWYGLLREPGRTVLVGSVGFAGPPQDGMVEVGYAVHQPYQGRGYATEMVSSLVGWALAQPGVERVTATTAAENRASIRVLEKVGFRRAGPGEEPGTLRFQLP